jgi:hypothetical protein
MSQHILKTTAGNGQAVTVTMGYDRQLDYVFCTVFDSEEEVLYSNLSDEQAGTSQQSVAYYRAILDKLGIDVPKLFFRDVENDQIERVGDRDVVHFMLGEKPNHGDV